MEEFCVVCNQPIPKERQRYNTKFCSNRCKVRQRLALYHEKNPKPQLCHATSGIVSEYRVIIDLLFKGYDVFHATSPASSCDLAVLKNNKLLRIEVRTGKYSAIGNVYKPTANVRADILATVLHDRIIYEPDLP